MSPVDPLHDSNAYDNYLLSGVPEGPAEPDWARRDPKPGVEDGPDATWSQDARDCVEIALRAADAGDAGHWPTVAGWLAAEVRRLRAEPSAILALVVTSEASPSDAQVPQPAPVVLHKPFPDDGVTYCGWATDDRVVDGCGEVWPCSSVRAESKPTPAATLDREAVDQILRDHDGYTPMGPHTRKAVTDAILALVVTSEAAPVDAQVPQPAVDVSTACPYIQNGIHCTRLLGHSGSHDVMRML